MKKIFLSVIFLLVFIFVSLIGFLSTVGYETDNFKIENYDAMQVYYKPNDKKYIIYALSGDIWFDDNLKGCLKQKKEIDPHLLNLQNQKFQRYSMISLY